MLVGTRARSPYGLFEVAVLVDGKEQPLYQRLRDGRYFVAGEPGKCYQLLVANLSIKRIEVINTVDGRNTLREEAGDAHQNRGLVFSSRSEGNFSGWRLNNDETAEFVFGSPDHSVAAQITGSTNNVGVIGFAAYAERRSLFEDFELGATRGGGTYKGVTRGGSLGTGIGDVQSDHVGTTSFMRDGDKPDILVIGYDLHEVLVAAGIITPPEPNPFPGTETGYRKYVK